MKNSHHLLKNKTKYSKPDFRKVIHQRSNHQTIQSEDSQKQSVVNPTVSRLESQLRQEYKNDRNQNFRNSSKLSGSVLSKFSKYFEKDNPENTDSVKVNRMGSRLKSSFSINDIERKETRQSRYPTQASNNEKLDDIERQVQTLINKKLQNLMKSMNGKKLSSNTLSKSKNNSFNITRGQNDEDNESSYQNIIKQIKNIKEENPDRDMQCLNKKIDFLQSLMAEHSAQSDILKKHFFAFSSHSRNKRQVGSFSNSKGKNTTTNLITLQNRLRSIPAKQVTQSHRIKPLFNDSNNRQTYKQPLVCDYESYRYIQQRPKINKQPFPRSSYKRQFLYQCSQPNQQIIHKDNGPYFPISKGQIGSTYGLDYKQMKSQIVNHKELDAYKNKLKTLKIDFSSQDKNKTIVYNPSYFKDLKQNNRIRQKSQSSQHSIIEKSFIGNFPKISESKRQYQGLKVQERSIIKNKQLREFQYKLKNLYKC